MDGRFNNTNFILVLQKLQIMRKFNYICYQYTGRSSAINNSGWVSKKPSDFPCTDPGNSLGEGGRKRF